MSRLDDLTELAVLLLKQIQDSYCFRIGGALGCDSKLRCCQVMLFARGDWIGSLGLYGCITCMLVSLLRR
jgi:hypothetical protein